MKRLLTIIMLFVACSCTEEILQTEMAGRHLEMSFNVKGAPAKAIADDAAGTEIENAITSAYYFFYSYASADISQSAPVLNGFFKNIDPSKTYSIPVSTADVIDRLFPSGVQKCKLVVVANPPAAIVADLEAGPAYSALLALSFTSDFQNEPEAGNPFVMVYDDDVTVESRSASVPVRVSVALKRLASKFTFDTIIKKEHTNYVVGEDGKATAEIKDIWRSEPSSVNVEFHNAFAKANLSGDFSTLSAGEEDYFISNPYPFGDRLSDYDSENKLADGIQPVYTYPMAWDFADQYEPYILFEVKWQQYKPDGVTKEGGLVSLYYKMMLGFKSIGSNTCYHITARLDEPGSRDKAGKVIPFPLMSYEVLDWNSAITASGETDEGNVDAVIEDARYLVTSETSYEMHNEAAIDIPYASSHDCSLFIESVKHKKKLTEAESDYTSTAVSGNWVSLSSSASLISVNHSLNNTISGSMDITPYEFVIWIYHTDQYEGTPASASDLNQVVNKQKITVIQYPAITATIDHNSAGESNKGWVFVNGSQSSYYKNEGGITGFLQRNSDAQYGGVQGINNSNPSTDMTVISVGRLDDGSEYKLGDPTSLTDVSGWSSELYQAKSVYDKSGSDRRLKYYYGTDSNKREFIAPKIRSTSGHARLTTGSALGLTTNPIDYQTAFRRCATYQEDGYPAGRWRLPSKAEIEFVATLSGTGLVASMFTNGQAYWCAGGYVTVNTSGASEMTSTTSGSHYVRCVYDEWYWEQVDEIKNDGVLKTSSDGSRSVTPNTFYWGDINKSTFEYR